MVTLWQLQTEVTWDDYLSVYAIIDDIEMDQIRVDFGSDGSATFNLEDCGLSYLAFDSKQLHTIAEMVDAAMAVYAKWDEGEEGMTLRERKAQKE